MENSNKSHKIERIIIDPPSGWLYGFPKEIPKDRLKDVTEWLIEQGYPKKTIDDFGEHFVYRTWTKYEDEFDLDIVIDEYDSTCSDGCCVNYGTSVKVNGVEMPFHNQDTETILKQVLSHLGYKPKITTLYNGK